MAVTVETEGLTLGEDEVKKGLRELQPGLDFDMGARKELFHPSIEKWQGVHFDGRHVGTMGRGSLPEYTTYQTVARIKGHRWDPHWRMNVPVYEQARGACIAVGWRHTFQSLVDADIPNITWDTLCEKFTIERKNFHGHPGEHHGTA